MNEGDVVLMPLPQADGRTKNRPCIALRRMPGFGDWLVCVPSGSPPPRRLRRKPHG
jgi:hypothetical protein